MDFIVFSFFQGVVAFFAPCAVVLLPGYITSFVGSNNGVTENSSKLRKGGVLAFWSIFGILMVYTLGGGMIMIAAQVLKIYMKWIAVGLGGILVILGLFSLSGKSISINLHFQESETDSRVKEAFFFGVAYAIGALGCLFPIFLIIITQAISAPSVLEGGAYIFSYFLGMGGMMALVIFLAIHFKNWLTKSLRSLMSRMNLITGILLIVAGIYIIQYQLVLF